MSQAAEDRFQYFDTNIFRIGFIGDSILRPNALQVEYNGSHPYLGGKKNWFGRMIYDYLDFNKPTWRSIEHTDWSFSGGSQIAIGFDGITATDNIRLMTNTDTAEITITGDETAVFWFEGGYTGELVETGIVDIKVSKNGGSFITPEAQGLTGRRVPTREGKEVVYDAIQNTLDTNLNYPSYSYNAPAGKTAYTSHLEVQYNDLNPSDSYTFRISVLSSNIRLGGCFHFTGKTLVVTNISIPGSAWDGLRACMYNRITHLDYQMIIAEALIYHDFFPVSEITQYTRDYIRQLKKYSSTRLHLFSCTPMGAISYDSPPYLGSEDPASWTGQNNGKEFNHRVGYTDTTLTWANYPDRDSVYRFTVGGSDYDMRVTLAKVAEENFSVWTYKSAILFEFPEGFPYGTEIFPLVGTNISGNGAASITFTEIRYTPPSFEDHRDLMLSISKEFRIGFVDMHQHFADIAIANGETIETDPYLIEDGSPLYPEYDGGYENYLSRYFQPNHLTYAANQPIFEKFRDDLFLDFTGK